MTIAQVDKEIKDLINNHHVYGAEVLISALARASKNEKWLGKKDIHKLVDEAYRHLDEIGG